MRDILDYLETQLSTFEDEPLNEVDSALLAQFCMTRGEGIMPAVTSPREAARARAEAARAGASRAAAQGGEGASGCGGVANEGGYGSDSRAFAPAGGEAEMVEPASPRGLKGFARRVRRGLHWPGRGARDARAAEVAAGAHDSRPVHFADLMRTELFGDLFAGMHAAQMRQQLFLMAASPRFRTMTIRDHAALFDEQPPMQFAATTYVYGDQFAYVGFRGTDTTLAGWREDFDMAYQVPVPAQDLAARYLADVAADPAVPERLYVGGHSKGGNLAEYAALTAASEVQARIARVFSHDGPGFMAGTFSAADYAPLEGRWAKTVPEDSMVGILMESSMPVSVVRASGKGFEQHTVFRWEVADDNRGFVTVPQLPEVTQRRAEALKLWLASMDGAQRERMVDALFAAIRAAGVTDAAQLFEGGREVTLVRDGMLKMDGADRAVMLRAVSGLARAFHEVTVERNEARRQENRAVKA